MLTWVIYDITDNKTRNRVIKVCKRYGLYRVQKSVFLGDVNPNELDSLSLEAEKEIDPEVDSVYIFPMCSSCFGKIKLKGQAFDKELVSDEILTKFF